MKICVYTIAKNEQKHIERWFNSVKDADYLLIADTGSTDETIKIATELGIQIQSIHIEPFRFDTAKNAAVSLIPKDADICINVDMDETLTEGWRSKIQDLWNTNTFTKLSCSYIRPNTQIKAVTKIHSRVGYSWQGIIHEYLIKDHQVLENHKSTDLILFKHLPDLSKDRNFYADLLEVSIMQEKELENYEFNLLQYAISCIDKKQYKQSLNALERCITIYKLKQNPNLDFVQDLYFKVKTNESNTI